MFMKSFWLVIQVVSFDGWLIGMFSWFAGDLVLHSMAICWVEWLNSYMLAWGLGWLDGWTIDDWLMFGWIGKLVCCLVTYSKSKRSYKTKLRLLDSNWICLLAWFEGLAKFSYMHFLVGGWLFVGSTFSCSESIGNLNSLVGMSRNISALLNRCL